MAIGLAGGGVENRLSGAPQLHRPQVGGELGGQVHVDVPPLAVGAGDLGGQGSRGVDDHEVAFVEHPGELGEGGVHQGPVLPVGHQHPDRVAGQPPGLGRGRCLQFGRAGRRRAVRRAVARPRSVMACTPAIADLQVDSSVPPTGPVTGDEVEECGDDRCRIGPVRDVLAGKGVLVHLGPHVAGIDRPHPQTRLLHGQHGTEVVERGLGRAVAAPPLVWLYRGIRRHVEDPGVGRGREGGQCLLEQGQRGDDVRLQDLAERRERVGAETGAGERPQGAGVVHHQVDSAQRVGCGDQFAPVPRVGDVPDHVDHSAPGVARSPHAAAAATQRCPCRASMTSDHPDRASPAASACPQPLRRSGDDCRGHDPDLLVISYAEIHPY